MIQVKAARLREKAAEDLERAVRGGWVVDGLLGGSTRGKK